VKIIASVHKKKATHVPSTAGSRIVYIYIYIYMCIQHISCFFLEYFYKLTMIFQDHSSVDPEG
jgi:hypothetical protein